VAQGLGLAPVGRASLPTKGHNHWPKDPWGLNTCKPYVCGAELISWGQHMRLTKFPGIETRAKQLRGSVQRLALVQGHKWVLTIYI
jgi:hypothetical protein